MLLMLLAATVQALGNGHVEVGIMLLSKGAKKECRDKSGKTAFQRAVKMGQANAAAQVREQQVEER
jgi:ankyrin repeat protein